MRRMVSTLAVALAMAAAGARADTAPAAPADPGTSPLLKEGEPMGALPETEAGELDPAPVFDRAMREDAEGLREIIGRPVYSADGERFGEVAALVVERGSDRVIGALVEHGGFLGAFENEVLVPAEQIETVNADSVVLRWTAAEMDSAPPVDQEELAASPDLVRVE